MRREVAYIIHNEPEVIDVKNLIYISDSDEEIPPTPIQKHVTPNTIITIDDEDDNNNKSSKNSNSNHKVTHYKANLHKPPVPLANKSKSTPALIVKKLLDRHVGYSGTQKKIVQPVIKQIPTFNISKPDLPNLKIPLAGKEVNEKNPDTIVANTENEPLNRTAASPACSSASLLPEEWSSASQAVRVEARASNALLSKALASSEERKLSLPRSAFLKNSTLGKRQSAFIKAILPLRNTSLKRPAESPERPNMIRSRSFEKPSRFAFDTTARRSPERVKRLESFEWPSQSDLSAAMDESRDIATRDGSPDIEPSFQRTSKKKPPTINGSPNRKPSLQCTSKQPSADIYGSPDRESLIQRSSNQTNNLVHNLQDKKHLKQRASRQANNTIYDFSDREAPIQHASIQGNKTMYGSPKRFECFLFNPSIDYPSEFRKPKKSSSPFSRPTFQKPKIVHELYDEDGEEDLELFVSVMSSTRRKIQPNVSKITFLVAFFNFFLKKKC